MTVWSLGLSLHPLVEGCCCGIGLIVRGVLICGEGEWQVVVGVVAAGRVGSSGLGLCVVGRWQQAVEGGC